MMKPKTRPYCKKYGIMGHMMQEHISNSKVLDPNNKIKNKTDILLNEHNLVTNKITSLSMRFSNGSYIIPFSLVVGIIPYLNVESLILNYIAISLPIAFMLYLYNHMHYMALQFRLSGYDKYLEQKINQLANEKLLLWENTLARANKQNTFVGLFIGAIYLLLILFTYWSGYSSLAKLVSINTDYIGFSIFITIIYYLLLFLLFTFSIFFTNEHNRIYEIANSTNANADSKEQTNKMLVFIIPLVCILFLPVSVFPLLNRYLDIDSSAKNLLPQYSSIIVLGNKTENDIVNNQMLERLDLAKNIVVENPGSTIILSGGTTNNNSKSEAEIMKEAWDIYELPNIIKTESQSLNTYENLINCGKKEIGSNVIVVTSDYHTFRVSLLLRKLNTPYKTIGSHTSDDMFLLMLKECYNIYYEMMANLFR